MKVLKVLEVFKDVEFMLKTVLLVIAAFIIGGFIISDKSVSELVNETELIGGKLKNLANEREYATPLPKNDNDDTWNMFGEDGEEEPVVPLFVLTTQEYAEAYRVNTQAADNKYSGRLLELTGQVTDVYVNEWGSSVIVLDGFVYMIASPDDNERYLKVKPFGKDITVWCYGGYKIFDNPRKRELDGCHIR